MPSHEPIDHKTLATRMRAVHRSANPEKPSFAHTALLACGSKTQSALWKSLDFSRCKFIYAARASKYDIINLNRIMSSVNTSGDVQSRVILYVGWRSSLHSILPCCWIPRSNHSSAFAVSLIGLAVLANTCEAVLEIVCITSFTTSCRSSDV